MRLSLASVLVALTVFNGEAFVPNQNSRSSVSSTLHSTVQTRPAAPVDIEVPADAKKKRQDGGGIVPLTAEEINARRDAQLQKLRMKDRTSIELKKEDLKIVYEDDDIVVVDKPYGVLTVSGKEKNPSLAQAVFDAVDVASSPGSTSPVALTT